LDWIQLPLSRELHKVSDVLHTLQLPGVVMLGTDQNTRLFTLDRGERKLKDKVQALQSLGYHLLN
jgi:hypothetical protein